MFFLFFSGEPQRRPVPPIIGGCLVAFKGKFERDATILFALGPNGSVVFSGTTGGKRIGWNPILSRDRKAS